MRVRIAIAIGLLLIAAGLAVVLLKQETPYTGDNGRGLQATAGVVIPAGAHACQAELNVPPDTGAVRMLVSTAGRPAGPLVATVWQGPTVVASGRSSSSFVDQPVEVRLAGHAEGATNVRVCVTNRGRTQVAVLGQPAFGVRPARVSDARQPQDRAMRIQWFQPKTAAPVSRMGDFAKRYGLEKASWVGTWTFWAALIVLVAISTGAVVLTTREVRAE